MTSIYDLYERAAERVPGKFVLTVLVQRRVRELVAGAAPLVPTNGFSSLEEVAVAEIAEGKVWFEGPLGGAPARAPARPPSGGNKGRKKAEK